MKQKVSREYAATDFTYLHLLLSFPSRRGKGENSCVNCLLPYLLYFSYFSNFYVANVSLTRSSTKQFGFFHFILQQIFFKKSFLNLLQNSENEAFACITRITKNVLCNYNIDLLLKIGKRSKKCCVYV